MIYTVLNGTTLQAKCAKAGNLFSHAVMPWAYHHAHAIAYVQWSWGKSLGEHANLAKSSLLGGTFVQD